MNELRGVEVTLRLFQFKISDQIKILLNSKLNHSIALEILYLKSFESNSIWWPVRPQIHENGRQERAPSSAIFVNLRPPATSNPHGPKTKNVELFKSYKTLQIWLNLT